MKKFQVKIEGMAPILFHNARLSNPSDPIVRKIKEITAKKNKKTDDDMIELQRLEFLGSLYVENSRVVILGDVIEGMLCSCCKAARLGQDAKAGLSCEGNWLLEYDGPKDPDALWENGGFVDFRSVVVTKSRIIRTRPIFRQWAVTFELKINESVISPRKVEDLLILGGANVGICDFRPKFGRFHVASFEEVG